MSRKIYVLFHVVGITLLCQPNCIAIDFGNTSGQQYHPFLEWQVTDASYSINPFDVVAMVTFTHSGGATREIAMFYAGNDVWKFRFCGDLTGDWSFATSAADADLDGHTGTVTISSSNAQGFLTGNAKYYWTANGDVTIPNYVMYYEDISAFHDNASQISNDISEFIDGHGFTGFHVPTVGGWWFDMDAATNAVSNSHQDPDPRTFDALELLISMTYGAGGHVHIWPWGDHSRSQTPLTLVGGIGGVYDLRLQRYIAARLGPIPGWSMGFGYDLDEWVSQNQLSEWKNNMEGQMAWPHLLGGRFHQPNSGTDHGGGVAWNNAMSYSSWEHHKPNHEVLSAAIAAIPGQPTFSEDRFRIRNSTANKDFAQDGSDTRKTMWYAAMAGGVASIWGNLWSSSTKSDPYPNKSALKTFAEFFLGKRRFRNGSVQNTSVTSDPCLEDPSTGEYTIFVEERDTVIISLGGHASDYQLTAVDALTPYSEQNLGVVPNTNSVKIPLPYVSDWGLHLRPSNLLPILIEECSVTEENSLIDFSYFIELSELPERINVQMTTSSTQPFFTVDHLVDFTEPETKGYFRQESKEQNATYYFRLEIIYPDGRAEYSNIYSIDVDSSSRYTFFPNPVRDQLIVRTPSSSTGIKSYSILDCRGNVLKFTRDPNQEGGDIHVDLSSFPPGMYFIEITGVNDIRREKILVVQ